MPARELSASLIPCPHIPTRNFFQRIFDRLMGRTYMLGIDLAEKDGDYSAITQAYKDRDGNWHITYSKTWQRQDHKPDKPTHEIYADTVVESGLNANTKTVVASQAANEKS